MEHLFFTRNWQGWVVFTQSPESSSLCSHFSLNAFGVISRWADMRLMSVGVKVGVIVLQQLAHSVQSIFFQTSASASAASTGISSGTSSSNLAKKAVSDFFFREAVTLNFFKSIIAF